jgi:archaellum biogenesis protein FlaJ (TadC family)
MDLWMKIAWAVMIMMMLAFMYPRAKHWMQHGPKAEKGDWQAAILPLLAVIGFVILLVMLVR